ncbi:hypothetical protein [Haloarcula marina]|uniref:hypothetical protein n=1 Tax=Haloarcula marina TaxID=2961574 RepID=UPI0020B752BB|nr:hypothetical protein [Halomicroarcula marina]
MSDLTDALTEAFADETDDETAAVAAENVAAFAEQYAEELTADDVVSAFAAAPYDDFGHRFDWLIGELAAATEDCTDSRAFRLAGYGDLAADPEMGS